MWPFFVLGIRTYDENILIFEKIRVLEKIVLDKIEPHSYIT